jgi:nitrous oxidase accessory protein NosD
MVERRLCAAALLLALHASASARDWFVATDGDDAGDGTAEHPLLSPQKALDLAQPGDRVVVRRGVHRGRIVVTHGGQPGSPLTFVGEEGAVLDGGDRFTGWVAAPGAGPGVYRNETIPYAARLVSWKSRTILDLGGGYTYTDDVAREILKKPPRDPYWTGVEAHYVVLDGVSHLRFRDGVDPNLEEVAFAPADSAVVRLASVDHVVVRGFEVRNAYWGIALTGANDCTVEQCFVRAMGKAAIMVESGSSRNRIRDNELTQDYVFPDFGHPWAAPLHHHIWTVWKDLCHGDRMGIRLQNGFGDENDLSGNHVFRCFDAIVAKVGGRGTRVHHNVVENVADDGLALDGTEVESQWHDNLVIEGGNCGIVVDGYAHTKGPVWIYRNRVYHTQAENPGDGIHFKNAFPADVHVYVYHNSFSANGPSVSANDWTAAGSSLPGVTEARHLYFLNNVFASTSFYRGWPNWPERGIGRFAGNWVGGDNAGEWRGRDFFAKSNVVDVGPAMGTAATEPGFLSRAVRGSLPKAIDLSKPFTVLGDRLDPMPGCDADSAGGPPEVGAVARGHRPLEAPASLAAVRAKSEVVLTWKDRSTAETAFLVERSLDGTIFTTIARTPADATRFVDRDPAPAGRYRVRAADFTTAWLSPFSNVARTE